MYGENEVELMLSDLKALGVDKVDLILDKHGNSTWNSVINAKKIVGGEGIVIISPEFHLERALYLAKRKGIAAVGYPAKGEMSNKLWIREIMARVKMQLDLIMK